MGAELVEGDIIPNSYSQKSLAGSQIKVTLGSPQTPYIYMFRTDHVFLLLTIIKERPFSNILRRLFFGFIRTILSTIFVIQDISVALGFSIIFQRVI